MRRKESGLVAAVVALATAAAAPGSDALAQGAAWSAQAVPLAPHRAVYDLRLAQSRGKQSLEAVTGRILYDFTGNACDGYSLNFRQVTELDSGEGTQTVSDLRSTNWEDASGLHFRFTLENRINGKEIDISEGAAERNGDSVTVAMKRPKARNLSMGNVVFPSEHMRRIIAAAREGRSLLEAATYDGAETGEKAYNSLAVIGQPIPPGTRTPDDPAGTQAALKGLTRWPMTISYFDRAEKGGDQTPSYSISFELYENGIARNVKLDYGDFVLDGALTSLDLKDEKPCK